MFGTQQGSLLRLAYWETLMGKTHTFSAKKLYPYIPESQNKKPCWNELTTLHYIRGHQKQSHLVSLGQLHQILHPILKHLIATSKSPLQSSRRSNGIQFQGYLLGPLKHYIVAVCVVSLM